MDKSKSKETSFASYSSRVPRKQEKEVKASDGKWKDAKKSFSFDSGKSGKYGFIKSVK